METQRDSSEQPERRGVVRRKPKGSESEYWQCREIQARGVKEHFGKVDERFAVANGLCAAADPGPQNCSSSASLGDR